MSAEKPALVVPAERDLAAHEEGEIAMRTLPPGEDRALDVGGQQGKSHHASVVGRSGRRLERRQSAWPGEHGMCAAQRGDQHRIGPGVVGQSGCDSGMTAARGQMDGNGKRGGAVVTGQDRLAIDQLRRGKAGNRGGERENQLCTADLDAAQFGHGARMIGQQTLQGGNDQRLDGPGGDTPQHGIVRLTAAMLSKGR